MNSTSRILDELVEVEPEAHPFRFQSKGGFFSHYGPVIYAGGTGPAVSNTTAHELNHYWLHSATPYGLVLDELGELAGRETIQYCARLRNDGQSIPIPAMDVVRAFNDGRLRANRHSLLRSVAELHVVPWTHDVLLESWFEGSDLASVRTADLAKILRRLIDYEDRSRAMRPDEDLFAGAVTPFSDYQRRFVLRWAEALEKKQAPAFPTIGSREKRPLGAQHLFEACAQLSEEPDEIFWRRASRPTSNLYWGLFVSFASRYPGTLDSEQGFRSVVSTFMAIADLALFTPVGRVYGRLRDDSMTWYDLHPGWRLMQIMDKLGPDDWLEPDDEAPRLQSRLSMILRWPPPDRFLSLGAQLTPATHDLARHAAACRMRLDEDDRLIVTPNFDPERLLPLLKAHYPIYIRESGTNLGGTDVAGRLPPLLSYSLASFAWMVMRDGDLQWPTLFPPFIDFTQAFENVDRYEDLLAIYRGLVPFYSDDAFCHVSELPSA